MGQDQYRIDSHKLMYHVKRVNDWLEGGNIYPIYMEISPSGMCNHRCKFCALDFMEYQKRFLDVEVLKVRLAEMAELGLKSVMFAGEGEPLLHKKITDIINCCDDVGINSAMTTNAVFLKKTVAEQILGKMEWMKVSINAGTADTYAKIHCTNSKDFDRVISNLSEAAKIRAKNNYKCTLGMQILLLPENKDEVKKLCAIGKDIGMDYVVVKPYSQHLLSNTEEYKNLQYCDCEALGKELLSFNDGSFSVIFREKTMKKWDEGGKDYAQCLALPFWSYMDAGGNIWGCSMFLGDEKFRYGNINENTFEEIWNSSERKKSLEWVSRSLDSQKCRINCRMDEINRYLWSLKVPPSHVNFI